MRFLLLTIIALLPTYLVRFHIGNFPTTLLEILLILTFLYWLLRKISGADVGEIVTKGVAEAEAGTASDRGRRSEGRARAAISSQGKLRASFRAIPRWLSSLQIPLPPILLFVLAATISIFISPNTRSALGLWKAYVIEPILFFFMFTDTLRPRSGQATWPAVWRDVTIALSLSALGVALPAIYQKWSPVGIPNIHWAAEATRRVTSWYGFPNAIGLYLAPLIPFFVAQLVKKQKLLVTSYWLLVTVATVVAIVFARSEGALAALLVVGVTAGLFVKHTRVGTTTIALIFLVATLTNTPWRDYAYEQVTLRHEAGPVRLMQWKEATTMLRDTSTPLGAGRPLLGTGLAGYPTTIAPYHKAKHIEIYQYPHNIVLNFWSELGLLGLIAFFWLIINFFRKTLSPHKFPLLSKEGLGVVLGGARGGVVLASMSVILIHGLVDVPYFKNDLAIFFWLLLALTFAQLPSSLKTTKE